MKRGEEPGRGQRGSSEHQLLSSACCMSGACTGPEASGRVACVEELVDTPVWQAAT